ncbi:hypothetical protein HZS_6250 [Henneguya salminicola]|nr:hypothetical protein HZS_6250 [Henneguya salminicola]
MSFTIKVSNNISDLKSLYESFLKHDHSDLNKFQKEYCHLTKLYQDTQDKFKLNMETNKKKLQNFQQSIKRLKKKGCLEDNEILALNEISANINTISNQYEEYALGLPKKPK